MRPVLLFALAGVAVCQVAPTVPPLMILHKGNHSLGFYDSGGKLEKTVSVGQHPHEMVLSADRRLLYVADNGTMRIEQAGAGGNTVSIVDVRARKKAGEISLGEFHRPHGIDLDRKSGRLLVTAEAPDRLLLVDPVSRAVVRNVDTKGKTSHMVTAGQDGRWAYVSNSGSGTIAAVDLESGAVTVIEVGERPEGSVLSKDGKLLYVAVRESHYLAVIDTTAKKLTGRIQTGKGPVRIALTPDGRYVVYAAMHDEAVEWVDTQSRKMAGRVKLNAEKGGIVSLTLSPDGSLAFASAEEDDTVYVVSLPLKKILRTLKTSHEWAPDPVLALP